MEAPKPIVIVAGLGRCGSSMLMQMLRAGGIEPSGGVYPFYEDERVTQLPDNSDWLNTCRGKAVKILSPHRFCPPRLGAKVIYLTRDAREQAASRKKTSIHKLTGKATKLGFIRGQIKRLTPKAIQASRYAAHPNDILILKFEDILKHPSDAANKIAEYTEMRLKAERMAQVVIRRDAKCYVGFLEDEMLRTK